MKPEPCHTGRRALQCGRCQSIREAEAADQDDTTEAEAQA